MPYEFCLIQQGNIWLYYTLLKVSQKENTFKIYNVMIFFNKLNRSVQVSNDLLTITTLYTHVQNSATIQKARKTRVDGCGAEFNKVPRPISFCDCDKLRVTGTSFLFFLYSI